MANRYLAIDEWQDYTLPDGRVVAVARDISDLRAAGFAADPYSVSNNRLVTIDDGDAAWDSAIAPGWFRHEGAYSELPVRTVLRQMKDKGIELHEHLDDRSEAFERISFGQDRTLVGIGHDYIWRKRGAMYLRLTDSSLTAAQRLAWAEASLLGPADIADDLAFYRAFSLGPGQTATNWVTWARIEAAGSDPAVTRLNFADMVVVAGTVPDTVDLTSPGWLEDIAS